MRRRRGTGAETVLWFLAGATIGLLAEPLMLYREWYKYQHQEDYDQSDAVKFTTAVFTGALTQTFIIYLILK